MAEYETLRYEESDAVATVTLNRPERLNSFNTKMAEEIHSVWRGLRYNDRIRCVVLTGAGDKAFCTGIDRGQEVPQPTSPFMVDDPGLLLGPKSAGLWKPVIAAVNGMACGGAFYFLGEVEFTIAAEHATFFDPHVTYGMTAAFEPILMRQYMPFAEIMRLTLMGNHERMSAARAFQIGLVSEVVPGEAAAAAGGPRRCHHRLPARGGRRGHRAGVVDRHGAEPGPGFPDGRRHRHHRQPPGGARRGTAGLPVRPAPRMEPAMTITPADARLDGKVAVVTGAAQGIGEATALALAAFGADVAVCDRAGPALAETASAIRGLGRRAEEGVLDVRDEAAAAAWVGRLGDVFGKVDVLVNNAGGGFHAWFMDVNAKGQTALVNENFTSVTTFIRGCVPLMTDGGSIVNVTSIEAFRAGPGFAIYSSMKAGRGGADPNALPGAGRPRHPGQHHRAGLHPHSGRRWPGASRWHHRQPGRPRLEGAPRPGHPGRLRRRPWYGWRAAWPGT